MAISGVTTQLRTTDLAGSVRFYTTQVGLTLDFQYEDFYAGIRAGRQWMRGTTSTCTSRRTTPAPPPTRSSATGFAS
jgi:hypothetical protein